ncbi:AAA family ATPase [uncultured Enterovirga sp.]|uniref:nSTAND1 domain-containing NTPase n=1 Tax=uncultured Enterovirga sp. TaxID=2026352 RepID=UPI0035CBB443
MRKTLRIFISSPGDVQEERLRAHLVVQKLARDYQRFFRVEPYLWEYEPMLASGHFQDAIEPPSRSDVLVLVVYSRLGTPLPERTASREYRGIDGRTPVTGTEWEFEEALEAKQLRGAPDLLAYRKLGDPQASLADAGKRAEQERQWDALERFWGRHFEGGGQFISGSKKFRSLEEFDKILEADLVAMIEAKIAEGLRSDAGLGEVTWLHGSPFQGLAAYDFDDAPIFFGRDAQIRAASTRLQAAAAGGTAFLLVLGASGSGKSSLARAGLLPALFTAKAVPGVGAWRRVVLRPGENGMDPVRSLAEALLAGDVGRDEGLPELAAGGMSATDLAGHLETIADNPAYSFRQALAGIAAEGRAKRGLLPHEEARLVILVDQVEELFTREFDPARRALFVRILLGLARSGVAWVVATMRNDLWHRAAELPQLIQLVESGARLDLPAPGGAEIIEIVRRPAAAAGIVFEKDSESGVGLDAVISQAASEEPGALPLLSVMLQSLYERDVVDAGGRTLTFEGYRALGELKGAVAQRADAALSALRARDPEAAAALPRMLRAVVTASDDGTATSRPARLDAFPASGPEARLVDAFLAQENRLLVASERGGVAEVRLAHEALLENWPAAREQVATDRRDLQTRARLEILQRRWSEAASPAEKKRTLLASLNLAEGTDLVRRWEVPRNAGLGAYVAQSEAAERWRRRSFAVAASILVLIFAGIAAVASLQWRRAEEQSVVARAAEATEREARGAADQARRDAERERDRADGEKARALAALREAKRGTARTLSVQADLAADRSEFHRALSIAATAGETENDVLDPGERSASHPALLKALADYREVLHIDRPKGGGHTLPHDFLGNDTLVYADMRAGIVLADLPSGNVRPIMKLPEDVLPLHLRGVPSAGLIVMSSVKNVFIVEAATGSLRAKIGFEERITGLDIDEASRTVVIGTGNAISFIDLDAPVQTALIRYPAPRDGYLVGQVRFRGSRKVLAGYGAEIREFDRDATAFGQPLDIHLAAEKAGIDRNLADMIAAQGLLVLVEMNPDPARDRVLYHSTLHLQSVKSDGRRFDYPRDTLDSVLGLAFTGADRSGDVLSIMGRRVETGIDLRIAYISEEAKPLVLDTFRISAADLNNEQLQSCKLSRDTLFLVCTYNGKNSQGIFVWHVVGGKHRAARLVKAAGNQVSAASLPGSMPRLLFGSKAGMSVLPGDSRVDGAVWGEDWRLGEPDGAYVPATGGGKVQVFRADADGSVVPVLPPTDGASIVLRGAADRAVVATSDRAALFDLKTGRPLWSVPGLAGLRAVGLDPEGLRVVAVTGDQVFTFDARTGRIAGSHPIVASAEAPVAIDRSARHVAFVGPDGPQRLDVESGAVRPLRPGQKGNVVQIAFGLDADRILLALQDGGLLAVTAKGEQVWTVSPPSDETFEATALPGQKPRGTILQLAVSRGQRVAIVRQDMLAVDLHDLASGQFLTQLTPPWMAGVPGHVAFDPEDRIVTAWSLHPLIREKSSAASLHALPLSREEALKAVEVALAKSVPRLPDGSPRTSDQPRSN